jgi:hypothetical protein
VNVETRKLLVLLQDNSNQQSRSWAAASPGRAINPAVTPGSLPKGTARAAAGIDWEAKYHRAMERQQAAIQLLQKGVINNFGNAPALPHAVNEGK